MTTKSMLMSGALAVALALAAGSAGAADLNHNAGSTLTLTGAVSYDNVNVGVTGGGASTVVDASGTTSFTSNGTVFYVGVNLGSTGSLGKLHLGASNDITATTRLVIGGNQPDSDQSGGHNGQVTTAANSTTTIATPYMAVGTSKGTGTFTLGTGTTLNLGSSSSRTELLIGRQLTWNGYDRPGKGTMTLTSGTANLYLSSLTIGRKTNGGGTTTAEGTLTLGTAANLLDISGTGSVVNIGHTDDNRVTGTLTISNLHANSSITTTSANDAAIRVGVGTNGVGTMNLNGGTLKITTGGSAAIAGGGGTTRALNLASTSAVKLIAGANSADWINGLSAAVINANGLTIDTDGKEIGISQAFSGTGGLTKAGEGQLTLSAAQTYSGGTSVTGGSLVVNNNLAGNVTVSDGAAVGGSGVVADSLTLSNGAGFVFSKTDTLTVNGNVSLGDLSVTRLLSWGLSGLDVAVDNVYTLIDSAGTWDWGTVATGRASAVDIGEGKSAYFQNGSSLQLVVISEPAGLMLLLGAAEPESLLTQSAPTVLFAPACLLVHRNRRP